MEEGVGGACSQDFLSHADFCCVVNFSISDKSSKLLIEVGRSMGPPCQ